MAPDFQKTRFMRYIHNIIMILFISMAYKSYAQCNGATSITLGNCLNGQTLPNSAGSFINGGCNGGQHPYKSFVFTAPPTCVNFDITNIVGNGIDLNWQYRFLTTNCGYVTGGCMGNVSDGQKFTISADNTTGAYQLTPGTNYILQLMGDNACTYSICMSNAVDPSDNCAGALGLGVNQTTYYNGGQGCRFSGTLTGGANDPTAVNMCAGSLENTQWVKFSPVAGVQSFQVVGSNIDCSGGACAYQFGIFSSPTPCGALTPEGCVSNGTACAPGPDPNQQISQPGGNNLVWSGVSDVGFTSTISAPNNTNFSGNEVFYLIMDGNAGANCSYQLMGINLQPLPINLIHFWVKPLNNVNLISFKVASQTNNDYFMIQSSIDNELWEDLHQIEGLINSSETLEYGYADADFRTGLNYYRLKQVNLDGSILYSESYSVNNSSKEKEISAIYNTFGQIVPITQSGIIIIHYTDGTIEKRFN